MLVMVQTIQHIVHHEEPIEDKRFVKKSFDFIVFLLIENYS